MDLNICLYCEKRLSEDNVNFCSLACEAHEASKSYALVYPTTSNNCYPQQAVYQHQQSYNAPNKRSRYYIDSSITPAPVISYHRRRSLYYPKDHPRRSSFSSSSSLSSLTSTTDSSSASSILFASHHHYHSRPTTDNTSMLSYESSSSADMDDHVHTFL
ncbi:hypothetical protein INT45_011810 [Circinella minor]|uniref:Uncharacterized protein n=1 Tax=Circinella minor TaxID=1195481 RepID=A0A8H7VN65_9FUNG|nr:hypothetical protein INT45_011810 [Circinella minor]